MSKISLVCVSRNTWRDDFEINSVHISTEYLLLIIDFEYEKKSSHLYSAYVSFSITVTNAINSYLMSLPFVSESRFPTSLSERTHARIEEKKTRQGAEL
jgi:hypothetical protein